MNSMNVLTMPVRLPFLLLCAWASVAPADAAQPQPIEPAVRPVDYVRDIKPLLARRCTSCHGALRQKSGLRVDAAGLILEGGDSGAAIVRGKPGESLLIDAVRGRNGFPLMPKEGGALSEDEIALLERWIARGAPAPENEPIAADPRDHWAFRVPQRPSVPVPATGGWPRNPVDAFLAVEHQRQGLTPAAAAPPHVLLRRLHLDLIGLPPTPDELTEFLADSSPDACEKVIDRLLASPHYGERWGRHWMDVWRYSDWYGYGNELRNSARHIWRWRDWIVESLNAGRPYDRMVVEMLAADELAPTERDALRATGYLARGYFKFNRDTWLDDTIEHTGKAFLGLTINCARCHDHMYDPVSQREYYQFRAIFEPYQVRTDRVPGVSDVTQDGLPRVYDADLDKQTFVFERGNDKRPDQANPLSPAVPQAVAADAEFDLQPVSLPVESWYPGFQDFVQQETLAEATAAVAARRAALETSRSSLAEARRRWDELSARLDRPVSAPHPGQARPDAVPPDERTALEVVQVTLRDAEQAVTIANEQLAAARLTLEAVKARVAADEARFAVPPDEAAETLARAAAELGHQAAVRQAEVDVAAGELAVARAGRAKLKDGRPDAKAARNAQASLDAAGKRLAELRKSAENPADSYKPLSDTYPQTSTGRRMALARWIVDERNPLTARVAVNHVWLRHFGSPLVPTVFDFGRNGQPPTHPALLDWLAVEFREGGGAEDRGSRMADRDAGDGRPAIEASQSTKHEAQSTNDHSPLTTHYSPHAWSLKHLHRLLVTSAAYRMVSSAPADHPGWSADRDNRWLWRMNPRRMEAEIVRDSVLAAACHLDRRMGGPELDQEQAQVLARRSIYFRHAPEKHVQFLAMFDSASTHECYRRIETVVPQQALAMANSRLTREQSRRLARELSPRAGGGSADPAEPDLAFIQTAYERILCRPPTPDELVTCSQFLDDQAARLADAGALTALAAGETSLEPAADPHARARENLVHVLFNHNEFITIR